MEYGLNFHQTFAPEREAIAQIVRLASLSPDFMTKEEISEQTSIPTGKSSGKVVPHIYYAEAMGLIKFEKKGSGYKIGLTNMGTIVFEEDPYFIEDITKWACHYNLSKYTSPARMWAIFFNELVPKVDFNINKSNLIRALSSILSTDKVDIRPLIQSYIKDYSLNINLLEEETDQIIIKKHNVNRNYSYLYAYQLLNLWDSVFPDNKEVTFNEIVKTLNFGNPYIWDENDVFYILELLEEKGIINLNRQLYPTSVIRLTNSEEMLNKIYSLLI